MPIRPTLSVVIPTYNEEKNVATFYRTLVKELSVSPTPLTYEILYVNDGSHDRTDRELQKLAKKDKRVRIINFSRNFGKEIATTAGIEHARGEAIVMIDADGQHPPELIHTFLQRWRDGAQIVVGVRRANHKKESFIKRVGSKWFYRLYNAITEIELIPGSTDFRLIDHTVQEQFRNFTERHRITRGLIDWTGYRKEIVKFVANPRLNGEASYSTGKLVKLAMNSFVSLSLAPLYFSGYAGLIITPLALLVGVFVIVEQFLLGDPMHIDITGAVMLGILLTFLVGLLLISQGLIALYISHIHTESQNRPLYIIDRSRSVGL